MPSVYTPSTLADEWNCSDRHVRNLIKEGKLRAFKLGGKLLRIEAKAVEEYQCQNTALEDTETGIAPSDTSTANVSEIRLARLAGSRP